MKPIVVVPTFNERENLERLISEIRGLRAGYHILVADDNSPDGTGELADDLSRRYPGEVFVLHRPRKEGLGAAYIAAFGHVLAKWDYDVILQMDADLSHSPAYLPDFTKAIENCDVALGSRYLRGIAVVNWGFKRLLLSKLATQYVQFVTGMPYTDLTGGFKCWRRSALETIGLDDLFSSGYLFQIETTFRAYRRKMRIAEVPIIFYERDHGESKIDLRIIIEALWGVVKLRLMSDKSLHGRR